MKQWSKTFAAVVMAALFVPCGLAATISFNNTVTITVDGGHGTVSSEYPDYSDGETVTLTVTPDSGYRLDVISLKGADNQVYPLTTVEEGKTYTFVIGTHQDYFVTASFAKKNADIIVTKLDYDTGMKLAGAEFSLTSLANASLTGVSKSSGPALALSEGALTWASSGTESLRLTGLPPGTYCLTETKAPAGYGLADDIIFEVRSDGKVYLTDANGDEPVEDNEIVVNDTVQDPVPYVWPVYRTPGDATSGIDCWKTNSCKDYLTISSSGGATTWGSAGVQTWVVVEANATFSGAVTCAGDVHLIVKPNCTLTANGTKNTAGIVVSENSALTVYATPDGGGTVAATGGTNGAGIGGGSSASGGNITINGGTVTANGGKYGAAIGGGNGGSGSNIVVNAGSVTATGGSGAAGTAGGAGVGAGGGSGVAGNITINGGTVTAQGGYYRAGIGGGIARNIRINGGTVDATGGADGAGIGGGDMYGNGLGAGIMICGGAVTAKGGSAAAGIGGGCGVGTNIVISAGTVNATGGSDGAGIGGAYKDGTDIVISGGSVTAKGGSRGAGIGGGGNGGSGDGGNGTGIVISGGTVDATGGSDGSAIGGGSYGAGRNITISGGEVTAWSIYRGAAIGGGSHGAATDITIDGGTIRALACMKLDDSGVGGAAIGGGLAAGGSNIAINSGTLFLFVGNDTSSRSDFIGSGLSATRPVSSNNVVAPEARLFFCLESSSVSESFAGSTIYFPQYTDYYSSGCVLVAGLAEWTGAPNFVLKRASSAETGLVAVNDTYGAAFANKIYKVTLGSDGVLKLKGEMVTTKVEIKPQSVAHTTKVQVFANGVEVSGPPFRDVPMYAMVSVRYTAEEGYLFYPGATNVYETAAFRVWDNPQQIPTALVPAEPQIPQYRAPNYRTTDDPTSGLASWTVRTVSKYTLERGADGAVTWGTAGQASWYVLADAQATISGRITCLGQVNLILTKGCTLTAAQGITVSGSGNSLTVYDQPNGAGALVATGVGQVAAIGGGTGGAGSNITLNGGTVTATAAAGSLSAAIGGGNGGEGSNIIINGGTLTATGGESAAAIGGGFTKAGSDIIINGGAVTARGGGQGAGIGGGRNGAGSNIAFNGGEVTATGGENGAGIGGGKDGAGSSVTFRYATLWATGGAGAAAIGGGEGGAGSAIKISSGIVLVANGGTGDLIGCGVGGSGGSGNTVSSGAQILFNLSGAAWPASFTGFTIVTPASAVERVLVGNARSWTASETFTLVNGATGARGTASLGGDALQFANKILSVVRDATAAQLKLKAEGSSVVPPVVANATTVIYTNGVPVDLASIGVPMNTPVTVVYTAVEGCAFADGTTVKTNVYDTAVDPAENTGTAPGDAVRAYEYLAPVYIGGAAKYGIARWETNLCLTATVVAQSTAAVTWGAPGQTSWYVVTNADLAISAGVTCQGNVNLILCDGAKLTVSFEDIDANGITTDPNGSFAVYGQSGGTGALKVTAPNAGIGGNSANGILNVTINGGRVTATGGEAGGGESPGAGIGSYYGSAASAITINGGEVTAIGSSYGGAGIGGGGGSGSAGSDIVVNGGRVTAAGGQYAAGIGGSDGSAGSDIVINGGRVTATGGGYAAAIGGGKGGAGSAIAINGGRVTAIGGAGGAGIGGGRGAAGSDITIGAAKVFVCGLVWCQEDDYNYPDCIGSGYASSGAASGIAIADAASVFFNLTGAHDPDDDYWDENLAPMPEDVRGLVLMTPETAAARPLVRGLVGLSDVQATFALTNAVTGAKGAIVVNDAAGSAFANRLLTLSLTGGELKLTTAGQAPSVPFTPQSVPDTTLVEVFMNGVKLDGPDYQVVPRAYITVRYTAKDGMIFIPPADRLFTTEGFWVTDNPQQIPPELLPSDPEIPRYVAAVYRTAGVPEDGIVRWETNDVVNFTTVRSSESAVSWGQTERASWYLVGDRELTIKGGVTCRGHVNVVLCRGAKLTVTDVPEGAAGVATDAAGSFSVYGQPSGAGVLDVTGGKGAAAIGGGRGESARNITIHGGTVNAYGGNID